MLENENEMSEERFLEAYKKKEYPKPSLTADIAVFRQVQDGVEVLMIRRGRHPYQGCWALPGGFANPNEDVKDAAQRELEEETGVTDVPLELFGIYGAPGRDPRGWTVSGGFCTLIGDDAGVRAGDDAADARWCKIVETSNAPQADAHGDALRADAHGDATRADAHGDATDERVLTVTCTDEDTLSVRFEVIAQRFDAPRARVVECEGFAFDHALLLAEAYLKVTQPLARGCEARRS